jgi:hypothetical protein
MSKWAKPHVVTPPAAVATAPPAPAGPKKDPTWYTPVCDVLLAKISRWLELYERGDESASRPFVTLNGRVVDRVTMYAHRIRFKTQEIDHLVRLLHALAEHQELTSDFTRVRQGMTKLKLVPGGEYEVPLNFYKQDVMEILDVLVRAKTGRLKTVEQTAKEQADAGKGMFEL